MSFRSAILAYISILQISLHSSELELLEAGTALSDAIVERVSCKRAASGLLVLSESPGELDRVLRERAADLISFLHENVTSVLEEKLYPLLAVNGSTGTAPGDLRKRLLGSHSLLIDSFNLQCSLLFFLLESSLLISVFFAAQLGGRYPGSSKAWRHFIFSTGGATQISNWFTDLFSSLPEAHSVLLHLRTLLRYYKSIFPSNIAPLIPWEKASDYTRDNVGFRDALAALFTSFLALERLETILYDDFPYGSTPLPAPSFLYLLFRTANFLASALSLYSVSRIEDAALHILSRTSSDWSKSLPVSMHLLAAEIRARTAALHTIFRHSTIVQTEFKAFRTLFRDRALSLSLPAATALLSALDP